MVAGEMRSMECSEDLRGERSKEIYISGEPEG